MQKQRSFLKFDKLQEYWGGTFAYLDGELVNLKQFQVDDSEDCSVCGYDNCSVKCVKVFYKTTHGPQHQEQTFHDIEHYDEMLTVIRPFLPHTQYFLNKKGLPFLLSYYTCNDYKRSMSSGRYHTISKVLGSKLSYVSYTELAANDFNTPPVISVSRATDVMEMKGLDSYPLSKDFALLEVRTKQCTILMYRSFPVGILSDWGGIILHQKYINSLGSIVKKHWEVSNVS